MKDVYAIKLIDLCTKSVEDALSEKGITVAPLETKDKNNRRKLYANGEEIDNCTAYEAMERYLRP